MYSMYKVQHKSNELLRMSLEFASANIFHLQRSKLRPFWSPWRVEKIFGDYNSGKSRQLATYRFKEKLT